jgi:serine/threonine-protein phosphatase 4 regulatory subunit 1
MSDFFGFSSGDAGYDGEEHQEGEINEDLEIDDDLTVAERIKKYIKSDLVLHRLYIVRELSEAANSLGFSDARAHVIAAMEDVLQDVEPVVRQALMEQVPLVTRYFIAAGQEAGYTIVLHILLPMVAELTTDRNAQVRAAAVDSLEIMASEILHHEDLEPYLIPIIKSLANDATEEEHRVEAATLFHNLAPIFGPELCMQVVLPLVVKLAEDSVFRVRKAIAANIGNICRTVGVEATTQHLLPVFVALAADEIWGVRKGCAESLVAMAESVSPIERYSNLVEVFEKLADDQSRWVRSAAFQNLGPFISTFESHQVTPKLLRYYTGMVSTDSSHTGTHKYGGDSDVSSYCAFSFPAVLQTVGSARWGELSDTYFTLVNDLQWKVRRSLSHSLHEVAKILGPQITDSALLPAFDLFLKDLDEVRVGVVRNIASFLAVTSPAVRESYLSVLSDIQMDTSNWRFRKLLAKQQNQLAELFSDSSTINFVVPLGLQLLNDPVYNVRKAAAQNVSTLLNRVLALKTADTLSNIAEPTPDTSSTPTPTPSTPTKPPASPLQERPSSPTTPAPPTTDSTPDGDISQVVIGPLLRLATEQAYGLRQLYAQICVNLVDNIPHEAFFSTFFQPLIALATDKVPNVRVAVATAISKVRTKEQYSSLPEVQTAWTTLQNDKDRDVREATNPQPPPNP